MYTIIGLIILYSVGHLFVLQKKGWDDRTKYEKVVTVVGIVSTILIYVGNVN